MLGSSVLNLVQLVLGQFALNPSLTDLHRPELTHLIDALSYQIDALSYPILTRSSGMLLGASTIRSHRTPAAAREAQHSRP